MLKTSSNDAQIKKKQKKNNFYLKIHAKAILSSKMTILTTKTFAKPIVDSGSLDITSGSLLKWPFMPKQGPRSSTVQYCTVLYGNYLPSVQDDKKNYHPSVQDGKKRSS